MVESTNNSVRKPNLWAMAGAWISGLISVVVALLGGIQFNTITTTTQEIITQSRNQGLLCMITAIITIVFLSLLLYIGGGPKAEGWSGLCSILMLSIFSIWWLVVGGTSIDAIGGGFSNCIIDGTCQTSTAITICSFLNAIILMFIDVVLLLRRYCGNIGEDVTDTELTAVGNIGVSTLEDGTDANLTAAGYIVVSTLEDGKDTDLTAVGINSTQIVVNNEIYPPNECPPSSSN